MAFIDVRRDGLIATVTINRPERRNAVTREMMQQLEELGRDFMQDEQTRAIIVRAEGRDFSVGVDVAAMPAVSPSMLVRRRSAELGARLMRSLQEIAGALDRAIMHMDADQFLLASLTSDYKEATSAFFEKRKPRFTGN